MASILDDEIHIIAYIYHWGYESTLLMNIAKRKQFVKKILKQKEKENSTD